MAYFILKAKDPILGILENTLSLAKLKLAIQGNRLLVGTTRHRSPIKTCLLIRKKRRNVKENAEKTTENMVKEGNSLMRSTEHLRSSSREDKASNSKTQLDRVVACKPMGAVYLDDTWPREWNQHKACRRQPIPPEINKRLQNPHKLAQYTAQEKRRILLQISQGL